MENYLHGESVTLGQLLPSADQVEISPCARAIRKIAKANLEDRGLDTSFIAFGFASWPASDKGTPVRAPILLAPVTIVTHGTQVHLRPREEDLRINPIFLFYLEHEHGCKIAAENLLTISEAKHETPITDLEIIYARLRDAAKEIKDFTIDVRMVLSNFAYQKMSMAKDLEDNLEQLASHDLIAALAGDPAAAELLRPDASAPSPRDLDSKDPAKEFLVLDADSSQQLAIDGVLSKQSGVIHGPPGTGKSQTIVNAIAELVAQGRRVLFVAEKRAALDIVLDRLNELGLGHLGLDLHARGITKKIGDCPNQVKSGTRADFKRERRSYY